MTIERTTYYEIYIKKKYTKTYTNGRTQTEYQYFDRRIPERSEKYTRGITEKEAIEIAGKDGTVLKEIVTRQRIK